MPKTLNLFRDLPCTREGCARLQVAKGLCRQHYQQVRRETMATKPCADCGKGVLPEHTRCMDCQRKGPNARFCMDCGKPLSHTAHKEAKRCWPCHLKGLAAKPRKVCSVVGCQQPHQARGFCRAHYVHNWRAVTRNGRTTDRVTRTWVASQSCQLCGYSKMRSHVHRPQRQGDYVRGNMDALCARCHDEVHTGLTKCPDPLI